MNGAPGGSWSTSSIRNEVEAERRIGWRVHHLWGFALIAGVYLGHGVRVEQAILSGLVKLQMNVECHLIEAVAHRLERICFALAPRNRREADAILRSPGNRKMGNAGKAQGKFAQA